MQLLPRYHRQQEAADDAARLTKNLLETGNPAPETHRKILSLIGDEKQLRGIPAIGRGVSGAITGTSPHTAQ